jgi:hypothetical protein
MFKHILEGFPTTFFIWTGITISITETTGIDHIVTMAHGNQRDTIACHGDCESTGMAILSGNETVNTKDTLKTETDTRDEPIVRAGMNFPEEKKPKAGH